MIKLSNIKLFKTNGGEKKYPKVIQLPITYRCNSKCVMCNIWKMNYKEEMTLDEFEKIIKDPLFKKVSSVGINGGEPFLVKELVEIIEHVLSLPSLQSLNIISNGFCRKNILPKIEKIYKLCQEKDIKFHLSFSLDGYGSIHDNVRGVKNAFEKVSDTIDFFLEQKDRFYDSIDIGCTVVKHNVNYLVELDAYAEKKQYPMKYRLGIANKRIDSDKNISNYSVFYDEENMQSTREFFFGKFCNAIKLYDKFKYFSIFYFLTSESKRLLGCMWQNEGVTLDAKGNIYYCAVASKKIGSLLSQKGEDIFFDKENIAYRKSILLQGCEKCIHDYGGRPYILNVLPFLRYFLVERLWCKLYWVRLRLLWL